MPNELLILILRHILVASLPISPVKRLTDAEADEIETDQQSKSTQLALRPATGFAPAILATCKSLNALGIPMLNTRNVFDASRALADAMLAQAFCNMIGPKNAAMVKTVLLGPSPCFRLASCLEEDSAQMKELVKKLELSWAKQVERCGGFSRVVGDLAWYLPGAEHITIETEGHEWDFSDVEDAPHPMKMTAAELEKLLIAIDSNNLRKVVFRHREQLAGEGLVIDVQEDMARVVEGGAITAQWTSDGRPDPVAEGTQGTASLG